MPVFKDAAQLYDCLGTLLERITSDPKIGPAVARSGLIIRFNYADPAAEITIVTTKTPVEIIRGTCDLKPTVTMSMKADVAHQFWLGKVNLVAALTRGTIVAKGPIPAIMKLLPVVTPAFKIYPQILKEKGLESLTA